MLKISTATVFYLSLVATDENGFPRRDNYLFDIASELELKGYGIMFMSANDLDVYHFKKSSLFKPLNIYELVLFLIREHPECSYYLDEVPIIKPSGI